MKRLFLIALLLCGCDKKHPAELYRGYTEQQWIEYAQQGDVSNRVEGVQALSHYRDQQSIDALKQLERDPNVGIRYYAAESLWTGTRDPELVIPTLRSVISDPLGWSYRDRMIPLFKDMGGQAQPLISDIQNEIANSPNSRTAKWQECLDAIPKG